MVMVMAMPMSMMMMAAMMTVMAMVLCIFRRYIIGFVVVEVLCFGWDCGRWQLTKD